MRIVLSFFVILTGSFFEVNLIETRNVTTINIEFKCNQLNCYSGSVIFKAFNKQFNLPVDKVITTLPKNKDCYYQRSISESSEWVTINLTNCDNIFKGFAVNSQHVYKIFYSNLDNQHYIEILKSSDVPINYQPPRARPKIYGVERSLSSKAKITKGSLKVFSIYFYYDEYFESAVPKEFYTETFIAKSIRKINAFWRQLDITFIASQMNLINEHWVHAWESLDAVNLEFQYYVTNRSKNQGNIEEYKGIALFAYITGRKANSIRLGFAFNETICDQSAAFLTISYQPPEPSQTDSFYSAFAYELGHILGASHHSNESTSCVCPDPSNNCLMDEPFSSSRTFFPSRPLFSNCTVEKIANQQKKGRFFCANSNLFSIVGPSCGNGIIEGDEECDCVDKKCQKCCDICRIKLGDCGSGNCCNYTNCQLIPEHSKTKCRPAISSCDSEEFCDGGSPVCPDDSYKPNFLKCKGNYGSGYCFNGICGTYTDHCYDVFNLNQTNDECYENNNKGLNLGNCGPSLFIGKKTLPQNLCSDDSIKCGLNFCVTNNLVKPNNVKTRNSEYVNITSYLENGKYCQAIEINNMYSYYETDPSYVLDGSPCSPGKACYQHNCHNITYLRSLACPNQCSGKGDCNFRKGTCRCYDRRRGQDCSDPFEQEDYSYIGFIFISIILLMLICIFFKSFSDEKGLAARKFLVIRKKWLNRKLKRKSTKD